MTVEGTQVVPQSARMFPAIGGGYGVKMLVSDGNGGAELNEHGLPMELVLGSFEREKADDMVRSLNKRDDG